MCSRASVSVTARQIIGRTVGFSEIIRIEIIVVSARARADKINLTFLLSIYYTSDSTDDSSPFVVAALGRVT